MLSRLKRPLIILALAAAPLIALTACGSDRTDGSSSVQGSTSVEAAPSETSAALPDSDPFTCPTTAGMVSEIVGHRLVDNPMNARSRTSCAFLNSDFETRSIGMNVVFEEVSGKLSSHREQLAKAFSQCAILEAVDIGTDAFILYCPEAAMRITYSSGDNEHRYVEIGYMPGTTYRAPTKSEMEKIVRSLIAESGFAD